MLPEICPQLPLPFRSIVCAQRAIHFAAGAAARAIAAQPEIIYFDEPTSALDPELTGEVLSVMRQLADEGMTMLVVTHELGFARTVSSRTVFMEGGVVVESGPSRQMFESPREERTRAFLRTGA